MTLQCVIFDLDGTLADTLPLCIEALSLTAEPILGRRPTEAELIKHFGLCDVGILANVVGMDFQSPQLPREELYRYYQELHPSMCPQAFEGVREMLAELQSLGLRLALISGRSELTGRLSLDFLGLSSYFEAFAFGDPYYLSKKDRISELLEAWHLSPQEALYVGDAPSDIVACKHLGLPIVNAAWSPTCQGEAEECIALQPEFRLHKLSELISCVRSLINDVPACDGTE